MTAVTVRLAIRAVQVPAPRDEWDRLLARDLDALLEQGPAWTDALKTAGGWSDCSRLYQLSDGREFVLPLVRKRQHALAPQSGFTPSWGIGGLVGPGLDNEAVELISEDLAGLRSVSIHVRPNPTQAVHWSRLPRHHAVALERRAHVLSLDRPLDKVFARMSASARRNVRLAEKAGVNVRTYVGGAELDTYYNLLYLPSLKRWANQQHEPGALARIRGMRRDPLAKLKGLAESLGTSFWLTVASVDGQAAAGNIVLAGPNAHYTRGAMNELGASTAASHAAMWHAIERAAGERARWFYMGDSGSNTNLAAYKERLGAKQYDYQEFRYERLPLLSVENGARNLVKRVIGFKDV